MRQWFLAGSAVLAVGLAAGIGIETRAQDRPVKRSPDAAVTEASIGSEAAPLTADENAAEDDLLGEDELDLMVAPVALYPDSLLTQVLVASTYPLDIVKADRWLTANKEMTDKDRKNAAEKEDWDPSIQVLAGGFPTVVTKMATDIDWTQDLGDAMLAQSDDVLDAVQRQRARAVAVGNLSTNEAQVVDQAADTVSITPANPDVVYVPQYEPSTAFTTPYTTPPYVATNTGYSGTDLLTTGVIAFGSALLINEIFDDDDDDWDNYWHGSNHIDWDDGDIRPRPDIDINGDVNIDRNRNNIIANRERTNIEGNRIGDRTDVSRASIGGRDIDRDGTWRPSDKSKADARARVADREGNKGGGSNAAAAKDKLKAQSGGTSGLSRNDVSNKLADRKSPPSLKAKDSAFSPQSIDANRTRQATDRGDLSVNKGKAKQGIKDKPKSVSRPSSVNTPPRNSGPKSSAFSKPSGGGANAGAIKARGGHSAGGGHSGGGGRGGGGGGRGR